MSQNNHASNSLLVSPPMIRRTNKSQRLYSLLYQLQNYGENTTAEDICESSSKIIHFIDVPGHQKYLKTTIFGLMGHSPHFAMLVMSANTGIGKFNFYGWLNTFWETKVVLGSNSQLTV